MPKGQSSNLEEDNVITKQDLVGRERRKRPPRSGESKQQTGLWTCTAAKGVCVMKEHPRMRCAVHGSKEEAEKCIKNYLKSLEEAE